MTTAALAGPRVNGKFLEVDGRRFLVKGVAYGTFAPDADGAQFPSSAQIDAGLRADGGRRHQHGSHLHGAAVALLDAAARHGLRVMVGLPWPQHIAFLDDRRAGARHPRAGGVDGARAWRRTRRRCCSPSATRSRRPSCAGTASARIERFLRELYDDVKSAAPDSLLTYVNFPPTEYLDLDCFDVCAFNVYLHREADLRAYLARLQHIAGAKPLLLAEAGADSMREGLDGQARITAMHLRAAFAEGACGAVAFSWTDEWWRGGHTGRRLGVRPRRRGAPAEAGAGGRRAGVRRRAVSAPSAARAGRRSRWWSAPTTPPTRSTTA